VNIGSLAGPKGMRLGRLSGSNAASIGPERVEITANLPKSLKIPTPRAIRQVGHSNSLNMRRAHYGLRYTSDNLIGYVEVRIRILNVVVVFESLHQRNYSLGGPFIVDCHGVLRHH